MNAVMFDPKVRQCEPFVSPTSGRLVVTLDVVDDHDDYITFHFESLNALQEFGAAMQRLIASAIERHGDKAETMTLADAVADPAAFVEGMSVETILHTELPPDLRPIRKPIWDRFEAGLLPCQILFSAGNLTDAEIEAEYTRWKLAGGKVLAVEANMPS